MQGNRGDCEEDYGDTLQLIRDFDMLSQDFTKFDDLTAIGLIKGRDAHHVRIFTVVMIIPFAATHRLKAIFPV